MADSEDYFLTNGKGSEWETWVNDVLARINSQESSSTPYPYSSLETWWTGTKLRPAHVLTEILDYLADTNKIKRLRYD